MTDFAQFTKDQLAELIEPKYNLAKAAQANADAYARNPEWRAAHDARLKKVADLKAKAAD